MVQMNLPLKLPSLSRPFKSHNVFNFILKRGIVLLIHHEPAGSKTPDGKKKGDYKTTTAAAIARLPTASPFMASVSRLQHRWDYNSLSLGRSHNLPKTPVTNNLTECAQSTEVRQTRARLVWHV